MRRRSACRGRQRTRRHNGVKPLYLSASSRGVRCKTSLQSSMCHRPSRCRRRPPHVGNDRVAVSTQVIAHQLAFGRVDDSVILVRPRWIRHDRRWLHRRGSLGIGNRRRSSSGGNSRRSLADGNSLQRRYRSIRGELSRCNRRRRDHWHRGRRCLVAGAATRCQCNDRQAEQNDASPHVSRPFVGTPVPSERRRTISHDLHHTTVGVGHQAQLCRCRGAQPRESDKVRQVAVSQRTMLRVTCWTTGSVSRPCAQSVVPALKTLPVPFENTPMTA